VDATQRAHEKGLSQFIQPAHRPRFLESRRDEKLRVKLPDRLAHFDWLDERFVEEAGPRDGDQIVGRLRALGAPGTCFVLSEGDALDGRFMSLEEAIRTILLEDYGALVSCIPGRLAFYADEARQDAAVLVRRA
jgi:hypothetical protein